MPLVDLEEQDAVLIGRVSAWLTAQRRIKAAREGRTAPDGEDDEDDEEVSDGGND